MREVREEISGELKEYGKGNGEAGWVRDILFGIGGHKIHIKFTCGHEICTCCYKKVFKCYYNCEIK